MNPWWITGFADGESWFFARPLLRGYKKDRCIQVMWAITLRDDDEEVLYAIKKYFGGIGSISYRKGRSKVNNGQVIFSVYGVENCMKLVEHFTKYPLQSKKRKDFEIWRKIVEAVKERRHLESDESFLEVVKLCDDLRRVRLYKDDEEHLKSVSGHSKLYVDKVKESMIQSELHGKSVRGGRNDHPPVGSKLGRLVSRLLTQGSRK